MSQPIVPTKMHDQVKALAKSRGVLLRRMYAMVIKAGIEAVKKETAK